VVCVYTTLPSEPDGLNCLHQQIYIFWQIERSRIFQDLFFIIHQYMFSQNFSLKADMSDVYGTYTVSELQQAAVVVGGGVRAVVSSVAAVVGG
jgi:hypothetical protein